MLWIRRGGTLGVVLTFGVSVEPSVGVSVDTKFGVSVEPSAGSSEVVGTVLDELLFYSAMIFQ